MKSSFKKTALASVLAGTFAAAAMPAAEANVLNVSWKGAFTMLNAGGLLTANAPSDYTYGKYANGDGNIYVGAGPTAYGWKGNRTPISGTMSFDTSNGAGVGTVNPFQFFGDVGGTGPNTNTASALGVSFQVIDTIGTIVGTMLFDWNGLAHKVSIVLDGSGFFGAMPAFMGGGPTSTISGVGATPATNGVKGGSIPLGPTPMATKTLNTAGGPGCNGATIATQLNAYTIVGVPATIGACTASMVDDGKGGSPMLSPAFSGWNANFDVRWIHNDSYVATPVEAPVPVPAAAWLFGSGLLGLVGIARRKKKA